MAATTNNSNKKSINLKYSEVRLLSEKPHSISVEKTDFLQNSIAGGLQDTAHN